MTALIRNIKGQKRSKPDFRAKGGRRLTDLSLLEPDIDEPDPSVNRLIDALARAQAVEDHARESR